MGRYAELHEKWGNKHAAPGAVSMADLNAYESRSGKLLPASYVEQVPVVGAFFFEEEIWNWVDALKEQDPDAPQEALNFVLSSRELLDSLDWEYDGQDWGQPHETPATATLAPIAQTIMGGYVCFAHADLQGTKRIEAQVYHWDTGALGVSRIADSFEAFLAGYL